MKIALVGKGGSGKTTISSLFARFLAQKNNQVIAFDADINQHLAEGLGISREVSEKIPALGLEMDKIKEYLRGDNDLFLAEEMIKTTPPGNGSRFLRVGFDCPLYDYFSVVHEGVRVMATGPFNESDLGVKCYHSKTGAVELMLNHMIDEAGEYVLVDMTAGADSFASGMFTRFDVTFVVVEPTLKSLQVFEQYKHYAKDFDVKVVPVANKIESEEDIKFIEDNIQQKVPVVFLRSQFVRNMEKGSYGVIANLEPNNLLALEDMKAIVDETQKDWKKFYEQAVFFHKRNAEAWANSSMGKDLTQQIDPNFDLELYIKNQEK